MEGGLLLLLLTTFQATLHISSLVFLLSNVGKGSSSHTSPSLLDAPQGRLKLMGEAQKRCGKRQCRAMSRTGPIVCTGSAS